MNTYIITYTATDNLFRGISNGQKFSITANTAREAIIAFYKKNLAPLCFSASNGRIYNNYGEEVQTGDDWIQYGNARFTATLADEQAKATPQDELQQEVERLQADKEAFERLSEKLKQAYSDLQQKRLDECVANVKERQKLIDEVYNLKAENDRLKSYKKECQRLQAEVDRLKAYIEIQQERATNAAFQSLEVIQDLYNKSSRH